MTKKDAESRRSEMMRQGKIMRRVERGRGIYWSEIAFQRFCLGLFQKFSTFPETTLRGLSSG